MPPIRKLLRPAGILLLVVLAYLLLWPVPIDPVAWTPPDRPPLTGVYKANTRLENVERVGTGVDWGPEDVAVDDRGRIYASMQYGRVVRMEADGKRYMAFAETGGRPLGLDFDSRGNLIVADAEKGLLTVAPEGTITTLATEAGGVPFGLTDDVDVAANGTVYFSDATFKYTDYKLDLLEHGANGRLMAYDPNTQETQVLIDGLSFATGVAVSPDQSFVLVSESWKYRIRRHWLSGSKKGQTDIFIENLPGFPDGVSSNGRDTFWVALFDLRDDRLDALLPWPLFRKILMRLQLLQRQTEPEPYGFVLGLDMNGRVVHNLQDPTGTHYASVTSVQEHDGMLYLGSTQQDSVGRMPVPGS